MKSHENKITHIPNEETLEAKQLKGHTGLLVTRNEKQTVTA